MNLTATPSVDGKKRLNVRDRQHRAEIMAGFFEWLPPDLREAPDIDWTKMPVRTAYYLTNTVASSPYAPHLALIAGATIGIVKDITHYLCIVQTNGLFQAMERYCGLNDIADLQDKAIWLTFAEKAPTGHMRYQWLRHYRSLSEKHIPYYLTQLLRHHRTHLERYALPRMPKDYMLKHGGGKEYIQGAWERRKERSDILVPLHQVLVAFLIRRKQVAQSLCERIAREYQRVDTERLDLPHYFTHETYIPLLNQTARTISEVRIEARPVVLHLVVWDKASWVQHHPDRYSPELRQMARDHQGTYSSSKRRLFVQLDGPVEDLLWFGDIVEHGLLQAFSYAGPKTPKYKARWQLARDYGTSAGFRCSAVGLLNPGDRWFSEQAAEERFHPGDMIFDPEPLYRGILYGCALGVLALTSGARVNELQQISLDRRIKRMTKKCVELPDGKQAQKQVPRFYQFLLPKGRDTDEQRQLFPVSYEAVRLLGEIQRLLEKAHGEVPVIEPNGHSKSQDLKSERYYFQWNASTDRRLGLLPVRDVCVLLLFV